MYVELRKNGTFYLKSSVYNSETKRPRNTSVYLGSNPIQAKDMLKKLTDDMVLLNQIPDIEPYEFELSQAIDKLKKINRFQTQGVSGLIKDALAVLETAQQFIISAQEGILAPSVDCLSCRFRNADLCAHFNENFISGNGKYRSGNSIRCPAYELGQNNSMKGSIKLPCDFR